jgi:carbamoyltransferase
MYLGGSYTNDEVLNFITKNNLESRYSIAKFEDVNKRIAELLSQFQIVARSSGRGEWGARSLGNRAILANPSDLKSFYMVNDTIKMRDFWMPFAPTILDTYASLYIKNWETVKTKVEESLKFMILTVDSTELGRNHLRGALHQKDHTFRPQICSQFDNENFYDLLQKFEGLTGIGGILNTSLNLHGLPLVGDFEQTFYTFENSDLKFLAIENYIISKNES